MATSIDGGIQILTVPLPDPYLAATSLGTQIPLISAPSVPNSRVEVYAIDIVCDGVLVIDATDTVLVDLIPYDKSAAADGTTMLTGAAGAAGDLKTAVLDLKVAYNLWSGVKSLDAGDGIRASLTVTTPDTAGKGYSFMVAYRIREWSGQ